MASIRGADTGPELLLRRALWRAGARGWRCHWPAPGGRIDIAFTRWRVAVFVDGSFWHGHPTKWTPGRWEGYWDEKIKRNIARDAAQNAALEQDGWRVVRVWDFDIEHDPDKVAKRIMETLEHQGSPAIDSRDRSGGRGQASHAADAISERGSPGQLEAPG